MAKRGFVRIYVGYCEGCGRRVTDEEMAASMAARSRLLLCHDCLIGRVVGDLPVAGRADRARRVPPLRRCREGLLNRRASPTFIFCAFGLTAGFLMLFAALTLPAHVGRRNPGKKAVTSESGSSRASSQTLRRRPVSPCGR